MPYGDAVNGNSIISCTKVGCTMGDSNYNGRIPLSKILASSLQQNSIIYFFNIRRPK